MIPQEHWEAALWYTWISDMPELNILYSFQIKTE